MVDKFVLWFAAFVVRFRWPIVIIVLLVTAFFTYQLRYVTLPQELADISPKGHPYVELHSYMSKVFKAGTMVEIVVEVKEGDVFNPTTIGKVHRIAEELYRMPQTIPGQVISYASRGRVKDMDNSYDEYGYPSVIITSYNELAEEVLKDPKNLGRFKKKCLGNPSVYGRLISLDKKATAMLVSFFDEREFKEIFNQIQQLTKAEEDENHRFYVAGRVIEMGYLHQFMRYIVYLFGVAMAAIVLILFLAFGTWRGIFMPMWAGYVAMVWGLGSEKLLGFEMDIMTIIVPFMIMAIEVSHCVQILNRFYEEYEKWGDEKKAAEETLKGLTIPSMVSIVTDGAGFATLFFIPFKLLQQMALSATYGVVRIFFTTTIFIHAFVAVLPPPTAKEMERVRRRNQLFTRILSKVAQLSWNPRSRLAVFSATAGILIIAVIGANKVVVGDLQEGSPMFWADSEYNIADKFVNTYFLGTSPYLIWVKGDREKIHGENDKAVLAIPEVVQEINSLSEHLRARAEVRGITSFVDVLKGFNRASHDNDPRFFSLPNNHQLNFEYIYKFTMSGGPELSQPYFDMSFAEANIQVFVRNHTAHTIRGIIKDTEEWIAKNHNKDLPIEIQPAAGLIGVFSAIMDTIKKSQIESLYQISAVVFLFVLLTYRSPIAGLLVMGVLGLGTLITFATMGFGEIGLFIYTVPVASLGMGLGVDYAIYIISRMKEERRTGKSYEEAHFAALTHSGTAVLFTAMSIAIGVLTLLLSAIRFQAILGGMLAVVLIANMLGALILLPALIAWLKPKFVLG